MPKSREEIHELFQRLVSNKSSKEEMEAFFQLVKEQPDADALIEELDAWWDDMAVESPKDQLRERRMQQLLKESIAEAAPALPATRVFRLPGHSRTWWVAASIVLLLGAATYGWLQWQSTIPGNQPAQQHANIPDIEPGTDGAILTLGDGTQLVLDTLRDGLIAQQGGAKVLLQSGQLSYDRPDDSQHKPTWNTITTPKGRQFKVLLPDGTQAWLNAASSITYPTFFAGNERRVELSGEVYLEVAHNMARKFKVKVNNQAVIEVTGTQFNVKAYPDEPGMATTLLEGGVKMYQTTSTGCWQCPEEQTGTPLANGIQLKPGQQGVLANGRETKEGQSFPQITVLNNINTSQVMAWKNGFFNFEGATLRDAMNQLKRWYNIEVIYEETVPDIEFFGEISRNVSLSDLLKALEDVGVHFRIESGRKLIVLP